MLTAKKAGIAASVGSQASRQEAMRRKENASTTGEARRNTAETAVIKRCASECHDVFSHARVDALAVETEEAF